MDFKYFYIVQSSKYFNQHTNYYKLQTSQIHTKEVDYTLSLSFSLFCSFNADLNDSTMSGGWRELG